jgi:hypothetical protein
MGDLRVAIGELLLGLNEYSRNAELPDSVKTLIKSMEAVVVEEDKKLAIDLEAMHQDFLRNNKLMH